ncbi:Peroxiredoxin [compost metagenome]
MSVGRNFTEVLRALDALQLTYNVPLATPANWLAGQDVIVALTLNDDQAREKYGNFDAKLPYLRTIPAPK